MQMPINIHLSAYSFIEAFLFLIVIMHFSKVNFTKLYVFSKSGKQWENRETYCTKNSIFAMQKKNWDNSSLYVYFSKANQQTIFSQD